MSSMKGSSGPPKRQRRMLTISQKIELLDMLREGRSNASVGRHYGINESSVRFIKKEEANIRSTAEIGIHKGDKRVINPRNEALLRMESSLILWIKENNGAMDANTICTKARELYTEEAQGRDKCLAKPFSASKSWFGRFLRRFRDGGYAPNEDQNEKEPDITFSEYEQRNNDGRRIDNITPEKQNNYTEVDCKSDIVLFDDEQMEVNEDEQMEEGLTIERLSTLLQMTSDLQEVAQEWDPDKLRSMQFVSTIKGCTSVYKDLYDKKIEEKLQPPITKFFFPTESGRNPEKKKSRKNH